MFLRQERSVQEFFAFYPVISIIVIVNIILWILTDFIRADFGQFLLTIGIGNNFLISQGEYWRLLTPVFLHNGLAHVLFNSFALVIFGPPLEQMLGRAKFLMFYLSAGILGNIGTFLFGPINYYHLGASGAIYGIFGLYLYMIIKRKDLMSPQNQQIVIILTIVGFMMTFVRPNINIYAHIFGYVSGFLFAPLLLTQVRPFSYWRNLQHRRQYNRSDDITFDPNRWQKKRIPAQLKKNLLWIVLGILLLLAFLNRF